MAIASGGGWRGGRELQLGYRAAQAYSPPPSRVLFPPQGGCEVDKPWAPRALLLEGALKVRVLTTPCPLLPADTKRLHPVTRGHHPGLSSGSVGTL